MHYFNDLLNGDYIHVHDSFTGKMAGMSGTGTPQNVNPVCQARAKDPDSVCSHCYAGALLEFKEGLRLALENNYSVLTVKYYGPGAFTGISGNANYFRLESFGDTASAIHAMNYIQMAVDNPGARFGVWTKNASHYAAAFRALGFTPENRPENLSVVYSSNRLNYCDFKDVVKEEDRGFFDHTFTVYTAVFAWQNGVPINCAANNCLKDCNCSCYKRGGRFAINEVLKQEAALYKKLLACSAFSVYAFMDSEKNAVEIYLKPAGKKQLWIPGRREFSTLLYSSSLVEKTFLDTEISAVKRHYGQNAGAVNIHYSL